MQIQIAVRHDTADGRIKRFVESELTRIEQKYHPLSAEVVIDHEGASAQIKTVEINVKIPGERLHVKESSEDINKSLDLAIKIIEKQLQKHKDLHIRQHVDKPMVAED